MTEAAVVIPDVMKMRQDEVQDMHPTVGSCIELVL